MATRVSRLVLLLLNWIFLGGSFGLTLSSRLIHRFSDEAKEIWASRKGNAAEELWPHRESLEYYGLLLNNDLKKQRMKLAPQDETLYPSEGNRTYFFGNSFDWLHYTWIDIGTPNISFFVALDLGSDLLWVPCDCIQCAPLSANYYNILDRNFSEYIPSASSTSEQLPCSHQLCELDSNCQSSTEPCPYIIDYVTNNTSSSGYLVKDKLHLARVSGHGPRSVVQASIFFGCGRIQSGSYLDGAAPDGLMGLGPGEISVPSLLAKAGLIPNSFSICFNENNSGSIFFGDQGLAIQQSTPFLALEGKYSTYFVGVECYLVGTSCLDQTGFQALLDSGTSFTFLPQKIYNRVSHEFDKQVSAKRYRHEGNPFSYCYNASSKELPSIPTMTLLFAGNKSYEIHNPIYYGPKNQGFTLFCLGIQPTDENLGVIGQNFMMGYRLVFDRDNLRLHWSRTDCQDLGNNKNPRHAPSPSNGSSGPPPGKHPVAPARRAVPPAFAERSPLKSSAVSVSVITWFFGLLLLASTWEV